MSLPPSAYDRVRRTRDERNAQVHRVIAELHACPELITGETLFDTIAKLTAQLQVRTSSVRTAVLALVGTDVLELGAQLRVTHGPAWTGTPAVPAT